MRKALFFDDPAEFADFVRLCPPSNRPRKRGYSLYRIRHPERPTGIGLALTGHTTRSEGKIEGEELTRLARINVEEREGCLFIQERDASLPILKRSPADTLLELIELKPWVEPPQEINRAIFWLREPSLLPKIVTDSLKLGNDRIQFAPLSSEGEEHILLRIESPSFFLMQRCHEDNRDEIDIFYPGAEDLYLQWGWKHPLEDLWVRSTRQRPEEWIFFRPGKPRLHVAPIRWNDIYDAANFQLEFPSEPIWLQGDLESARFTVPLRLEPRARGEVEAELWMLEESDRPSLEKLLTAVDQDDLANFLLCVLREESTLGSEPENRYFIREKREGGARKHFDFGGKRFASYKGFHHLFLPVHRELQPQLRRDRYGSIFDLEQGQLTVVVPLEDESSAKILRFHERSFEPLIRLVDYIINTDEQRLESIMARSIFDFGDYALAPTRPDLARKPEESARKSPKEKKPDSIQPEEIAEEEEDEPETSTSRESVKIDAKFGQTRLEKKEAVLERALIRKGQSPSTWSELANIKSRLKKRGDEVTCRYEAIWLLEESGGAKPESISEEFNKLAAAIENWNQDLETSSKQQESNSGKNSEPVSRTSSAQSFILTQIPDSSSDNLGPWLRDSAKTLRSIESGLRMKERWVLWGEILRRNKDVKEQARVREDIRSSLSEDGLQIEEIPLFIRNRIFLDRELMEDDIESGEDGLGEIRAALRNLEIIESSLSELPSQTLCQVGFAITGRAAARRLGEVERASAHLERSLNNNESLKEIHLAWIDMFAAHAFELHSASRARQFAQRRDAHLKKLNKEESRLLAEIGQSLEAREQTDNPATFLSTENINRFYPSGSQSAREGEGVYANLQKASKSGDSELSIKLAQEALEHIITRYAKPKSENVNYDAPKILYQIVEVLGKLKWTSDGNRIVTMFEEFVRAVDLKRWAGTLYGALLDCAIAQGLLELRRERWAAEILEIVLLRLRDVKVPLDFIDVCSAALNTIEGLPVAQRARAIELTTSALSHQVGEDLKNWESQWTAPYALKLLDQAVEAAVSKDKLTLGYYKDYLQQDEMFILERVLRENFCG